ncbi:MAG: hypothetical protein NT031_02225 [Planctomycetota bacterium]|nr:hypothetical protein [Planctomycetota bacterium]
MATDALSGYGAVEIKLTKLLVHTSGRNWSSWEMGVVAMRASTPVR